MTRRSAGRSRRRCSSRVTPHRWRWRQQVPRSRGDWTRRGHGSRAYARSIPITAFLISKTCDHFSARKTLRDTRMVCVRQDCRSSDAERALTLRSPLGPTRSSRHVRFSVALGGEADINWRVTYGQSRRINDVWSPVCPSLQTHCGAAVPAKYPSTAVSGAIARRRVERVQSPIARHPRPLGLG